MIQHERENRKTGMNSRMKTVFAAVLAIGVAPVCAQDAMPDMDHSQMDHGDTKPDSQTTSSPAASGSHGSHGSMQGGSPPPDARDPHAYSGGLSYATGRPLRLGDQHQYFSLLFDRLEVAHTSDHTIGVYDLQARYGRDYDRLVLKSEGHADDGRLEEASTELFWSHAVAAFWDAQLGVRYDHGEDPGRGWLALGVQGLAPYWFEVDATIYAGSEGRSALQLEAEYELLITQRLILQPRIETSLYSKRDEERGIGSGVSELAAGLRLRYEIRREFAPYIGVEWAGKFGDTADYAKAAGRDTRETRFVAGLRFWY